MKILVFGGGSDIAKQIRVIEKDTILVDHAVCDITQPTDVDSFIQKHNPDVVINCAGMLKTGLTKDQKFLDWKNQVVVNLIGSFAVAQASIRHNVHTIIFIGSVTALYGKANVSAYSASKAGVKSLTQSLAMEGINAYCISPGGVDTKMRDLYFPDENKTLRLSPKDVVKIIFDCIHGKYKPGDNIIIRKYNLRKIIKVDGGQPWKKYLHIY